jgi:hypothetical protein
VVLTRASSIPLKLEVLWPVAEGTLELIGSQKRLIRSLVITYKATTPFTISNFQDLNLSELQVLKLRQLTWDQYRHIMDLALQSSCTSMNLSLTYSLPTPELFMHKLIQQVVKIEIGTC